MEHSKPILYIFSGLPGTGKSTLAKNLINWVKAVYIRIDTIEQGIRDLCQYNVQGEGYRLAYKIAEDNLKLRNNVISDQCNPIKLTREEWNDVAKRNKCKYINIEIICSDKKEHKRRAEKRKNEIENLRLPTWEEIMEREYDTWEEKHIIIDTANRTIEECTEELMEKIKNHKNNI
jgi:predicted kinase